MNTPETIPTWGYKPDGSGQIFDLAPGEALPDGWNASPSCILDPGLATAEALSARAAGREYVPPTDLVAAQSETGPLAELEAAIAENERLTAIIARGTEENAALVAEIEVAEKSLDEAATTLSELQAALAKAHEDGRVTAAERNAAKESAEALAAELAQVKADLDAATAPAAQKTGKAR